MHFKKASHESLSVVAILINCLESLPLITVRNISCRKVLFLLLSVILFTGRGLSTQGAECLLRGVGSLPRGWGVCPGGVHPLRQTHTTPGTRGRHIPLNQTPPEPEADTFPCPVHAGIYPPPPRGQNA